MAALNAAHECKRANYPTKFKEIYSTYQVHS